MNTDRKKIVWLASYPKSGNTWFRLFLSAILNEPEELDLNNIGSNGIFSSRNIFEAQTDIDSTLLYDEEAKLLLPAVFDQYAQDARTGKLFIKIHDAYSRNTTGKQIVPAAPTYGAVYFVRNPLDVVGSFSNHLKKSYDEVISIMNKSTSRIAAQKNNHNVSDQFPQLLLNWSEHVLSWSTVSDFPVLVVRYEDMLSQPEITFAEMLNFIGVNASAKRISDALAMCSFSRLQQKEGTKGFKEKAAGNSFFRKGQAGMWSKELSKDQAISVVRMHKEIMERYHYPTDIDAYYL